jgi:hypothetical protein
MFIQAKKGLIFPPTVETTTSAKKILPQSPKTIFPKTKTAFFC